MIVLPFIKTKSYKTDPGTILQECINISEGDYSKRILIEKINQMTGEEFHLFCNDIRILQNFYDTSQGSWVTDDLSKIPKKYREHFYVLK